jgi:hypothetical protein
VGGEKKKKTKQVSNPICNSYKKYLGIKLNKEIQYMYHEKYMRY